MTQRTFDPNIDLLLERVVDVPSDLVWRAWTEPELIKQWFTPAPWKTVACQLDLRPGGRFDTVFQSPEGQDFPNFGCVLEVAPGQRLVWTDSLQSGYRPANQGYQTKGPGFSMTAVIELEARGPQTKYTALVMHAHAEAREKHAKMGFAEGWGSALDQLVAMCKRL